MQTYTQRDIASLIANTFCMHINGATVHLERLCSKGCESNLQFALGAELPTKYFPVSLAIDQNGRTTPTMIKVNRLMFFFTSSI